MKGNFSDDHPAAIVSMGSLANCHLKLGQLDRAKELYQEELALSKEKLGPQDSQTLTALTRLGEVCLKLAQPVEAETYLDECLAIAKETRPDKWQRFETQSLLGAALVGQAKFADAEPLLLEAYAGLKDRESSITKFNRVIIVEAADRLVDLYEATNNAEELQKWQAERETMQRRLSEPEAPAGN
jgi:tetratricopeptide (TPR) repeat protein